MTSSFCILGRSLEMHGLPSDLQNLLLRQWHFPEHDLPENPYGIVIEWQASVPALESAESYTVRLPDAMILRWFVAAGKCWYVDDASGVSVRFDEAVSRIAVWGEAGRNTRAALYVAMCEAIRASGLLPLHAAVAARSGTAAAFLGPSGTGKTTTLLRAIDAGAAPIAEDLAWFDPDTLQIYGWDRGIRLWPNDQARIADRLPDGWQREPDGKLLLPYERLNVPAHRTGVLTRIVLLERKPDSIPGWSAVSPVDAVRALWEAIGVPLLPDARARTASAIAQLLPRIEVRRLSLGAVPVSLDPAFGSG